MLRILCTTLLASTLTFGAVPAAPVVAAKAKKTGVKSKKVESVEEDTAGESRGHNVTKLRQGSFLRRDTPVAETLDLRGELGRRRDYGIVLHYTRVAELDTIEALARRDDDGGLLERVESVRRNELRRYLAVMQRLREQARLPVAGSLP